MIAQLTVTDPQGAYWQLEPDSGQWLTYNGAAWVPPARRARTASSSSRARSRIRRPRPVEQKTSWGQIVWDVISVAGGAIMSAVWYWYSRHGRDGARQEDPVSRWSSFRSC